MADGRVVFVPRAAAETVARDLSLRGYAPVGDERLGDTCVSKNWSAPGADAQGICVAIESALIGNKGMCYYVDLSPDEAARFASSSAVQMSPRTHCDASTQTDRPRPPRITTSLRSPDSSDS